jgi:hypothetical protein
MIKNEHDNLGNDSSSYAKYTGMAFQMIAVIGIMTFAGYKIDEAAKHETKWVTAAMSLAGVFISLYLMLRTLKK